MSDTPRTDLFASVSRATNEALDWARSLEREFAALRTECEKLRQQRTEQFFRISHLQSERDALQAENGPILTKVAPPPTATERAWAEPIVELINAARRVVDDMRQQHNSRQKPSKWGAPFGAIAELSDVLDKHFPDQPAQQR